MYFDYLQGYQTFETIAEMDEAVATHLAQHVLTKSERTIVLRIAQSALKYPGAANLKAATIAQCVRVSTKTVYRAVKRLMARGILRVVARTKMNGIKGANMYQLQHVPSTMSERVPAEEVCEDAVEAPSLEKQTSSFNLLKTSTLTEIYNNTRTEMNDWQKQLYMLMMSLPLDDGLKDGLRTAILATPLQTIREFTVARDALMRIVQDIESGVLTIQATLRAVYKGAYDKAIGRTKLIQKQPQPESQRPVPFYNWLVIR